MFNDKPYYEVNREERFYCALFAHAMLCSPICRSRVSDWAHQQLKLPLATDFEVYLEVAALRDYWNDLGDPIRYDEKTHGCRKAVLDSIVKAQGVEPDVINAEPLFWTSGVGSKLWSPGRWNLKNLEQAGLDALKPVRWAFNAKPDILIMSSSGALVLEAKVESGAGRNHEVGYDQLKIQKLIVQLWSKLIPSFSRIPIELTTLLLERKASLPEKENSRCLVWEDVLKFVENNEVDKFTKRCLRRLSQYGGS